MSGPGERISLDIFSDVVCPWCYIGKRRLASALALRPDISAEIRWRPYQLDDTIPPDGLDRQVYLSRKFGTDGRLEQIQARIGEAGRGEGIDFAFDRIKRAPNTLDAHRLIRYAAPGPQQDALVERLFALYFVEGADIGARPVLAAAAADAGSDHAKAMAYLDSNAGIDATRHEIDTAQRSGVTGVPCFVIDGTYAVMGAQTPDIILETIDKVIATRPRDSLS